MCRIETRKINFLLLIKTTHFVGVMAKNGFMFMIDDQEEILAAVGKNGFVLSCASKRLQNNKEVVLTAVRNNGKEFRFASPRLKGNKEVVLAVCRKSKLSLNFASRKLRSDKEFVKELEISDVDVFKCCHCSIRKHKDIYLPALKKEPVLCKRFSPNVLLKLELSSLPRKNKKVIAEYFEKRTKEKDLFVLAKAKKRICG